jgi:hypothetical protein
MLCNAHISILFISGYLIYLRQNIGKLSLYLEGVWDSGGIAPQFITSPVGGDQLTVAILLTLFFC